MRRIRSSPGAVSIARVMTTSRVDISKNPHIDANNFKHSASVRTDCWKKRTCMHSFAVRLCTLLAPRLRVKLSWRQRRVSTVE